MSVFGTIFGGAAQAALGAMNNIWAEQQQREARRENYIYGEMAAQNADARTRALYNSFYSPEALMKQYRKAGLSPSMMFGGTPGQGGMSGAQGTGAAGPGALFSPMSMIEGAQIGLINAQAEKTKAETKTIEGIREPTIQEINANVQKLFAETDNKRAETAYIDVQTEMARIDQEIKAATQEDIIETIGYNLEIVANQSQVFWWQVKLNEIEFNFQDETFKDRKEVIEETVNKMQSDILRNTYGNALDEANIVMIEGKLQEINNNYYVQLQNIALRGLEGKVRLAELKNAQQKWQAEVKAMLKTAQWQTQTQIEGKLIDGLFGVTQGFGTTIISAGMKGSKRR